MGYNGLLVCIAVIWARFVYFHSSTRQYEHIQAVYRAKARPFSRKEKADYIDLSSPSPTDLRTPDNSGSGIGDVVTARRDPSLPTVDSLDWDSFHAFGELQTVLNEVAVGAGSVAVAVVGAEAAVASAPL